MTETGAGAEITVYLLVGRMDLVIAVGGSMPEKLNNCREAHQEQPLRNPFNLVMNDLNRKRTEHREFPPSPKDE